MEARKDILGLKHGTVYDEENIKTLRYGHLMIMADQDHDGSHIKGLIINFIHTFCKYLWITITLYYTLGDVLTTF